MSAIRLKRSSPYFSAFSIIIMCVYLNITKGKKFCSCCINEHAIFYLKARGGVKEAMAIQCSILGNWADGDLVRARMNVTQCCVN